MALFCERVVHSRPPPKGVMTHKLRTTGLGKAPSYSNQILRVDSCIIIFYTIYTVKVDILLWCIYAVRIL